MKKVLASILAITMLMTTLSVAVIPAQAEDLDDNIYFYEDFEDYTDTTSLWNQNLTKSYVTLDGVEENAWKIGGTGTVADGIVKVSADPLNSGRGKVLEINSGTVASGKNITVLRTPNGTSPVKKTSLEGKRVVIEGDIFIPSTINLDEDTVFAYYGQSNINKSRQYSYISPYTSLMTKGSLYVIGSGKSGYVTSARSRYNAGGEWHTYRYVIDVSEATSATHLDTVRGYIDGNLVSAPLAEGTGADSLLTGYPIYEEDGVTPRKTVDFWKRYGPFGDDTIGTSWYSAGDFYGIFMAARPKSTSTSGQAYYVDNMTAYYIDDLKLTQPDLSNYTGGSINLAFNQEIADDNKFDVMFSSGINLSANATHYTLKDMFKIVDEDGNDIDGINEVKLSADKKTVIIVPQNLADNTDYTVVISRYFRDKEGQGLTKNSTEYEIPMSVGTIVAFELKDISQTSISGFAQNRDVKITAEFSMNIDNNMLTNGIVVTNDEGETVARNNGWTATINAENAKIVEFDFGGLPTDSYTVTTNENFAVSGEKLSNTFKITITEASQPIVLFEETFDKATDTYVVGDNWIEKGTSADSSLESGTITYNDNDWHIQSGDATNGDFAGVVAVDSLNLGGGFSGNALRLYNIRGTSHSANVFSIRRNLDKLNGISLTTGKYAGKLLVVEMDLHTENIDGNYENVFMAPSYNKKTLWRYNKANESLIPMIMKSDDIRMTQYGYQAAKAADMPWSYNIYTSSKHKLTQARKFKVVLDQSSEKNHYRMYIDNVISSVTGGVNVSDRLPGHEMTNEVIYDIGGTKYNGTEYRLPETLYGLWSAVSDRETYIDNFKAYLVDPFEVESVTGYGDVFNTVKATVDFTFSTPVDKTTIEKNVVLLDAAGSEVEGGIESVKLLDGGYKLSVDLSDTLPGKTEYTIKLNLGLTDIYGNCISPKYRWYTYTSAADSGVIKNNDGTATYTYSDTTLTTNADCYLKDYSLDGMKIEVPLTTAKSTSLFAEANATIAGNTITTNVKFTNPETTDKPVWAVVAVYGEDYEMLGCTIAQVTEVAAGSTASETIAVSGIDSSKVKAVKLHVWDSEENMSSYHKSETIIGE